LSVAGEWLLLGLVRGLVGASPRWTGSEPSDAQRIYFANHSSHIDTVALWSALPPELRARTHPVAAADYWTTSALRRHIASGILRAVFVDRARADPSVDALAPLRDVLGRGDSLILFPEGTRSEQALPGPFKSGLYRLASEFPRVELIPVYLENLHRSMPKGTFVPLPLTCTVRFGAPLERVEGEAKESFLERARAAVVALA
jgi:1-acyl-sn-glycerol-3-phosphate acyltransferase